MNHRDSPEVTALKMRLARKRIVTLGRALRALTARVRLLERKRQP